MYLATSNSLASFHFEYLLGETNCSVSSTDLHDVIWNCLQATEISEMVEKYWMNKANGFHGRAQFPNCMCSVEGTHVRIKMPPGSESIFYNYSNSVFCFWL